jgi:hypothetical protein
LEAEEEREKSSEYSSRLVEFRDRSRAIQEKVEQWEDSGGSTIIFEFESGIIITSHNCL